ncbi:CAP domain-containing protein [Kribbella antibiotica]|uniref:CAP domain-containing protein n=1 Tax=Kribbella antibiotica TaxID=190195 RepID=A0A4R4YJ96_9ACTN|nr:CAP domain-containing protein [Kribbella antibiotica]TDD45011.1 CAP domain-containing protein [Kribbella antibiotica]
MTDAPTPRRHRGARRAQKNKRGLVGPIASALSVLVAIGPVIYLMSRDSSTVNDATKVLNVSEDTRDNAGGSLVDGAHTGPLKTVTKTLPNGKVTTAVIGSGANGELTTSTPSTPAVTPSGSPSSPLTTPTAPTTGVTTVIVTPGGPKTIEGKPGHPKPPTRPTPTKTETSKPPSKTPEPPPTGDGGGTSAKEREVLELTNEERENHGCGPLRLNSALVESAGRHASDMVNRQYMSGTNPEGENPGDRMQDAGYDGGSWGENIVAGSTSPQRVVDAWMNSDKQRANILNCKFTVLGVGYDSGKVRSDVGNGSWVQDFGRS